MNIDEDVARVADAVEAECRRAGFGLKLATARGIAQSAIDAMQSGWQPIESAPRDGTVIQAEIPGNGSDNLIAWSIDNLLDSDEKPCGAWMFASEQEPPECWTDGYCWEPLASPTHWMPLPPLPEPPQRGGVGG